MLGESTTWRLKKGLTEYTGADQLTKYHWAQKTSRKKTKIGSVKENMTHKDETYKMKEEMTGAKSQNNGTNWTSCIKVVEWPSNQFKNNIDLSSNIISLNLAKIVNQHSNTKGKTLNITTCHIFPSPVYQQTHIGRLLALMSVDCRRTQGSWEWQPQSCPWCA